MYQYKIVRIDAYSKKRISQAEQTLNELADEGWEPFIATSSHFDVSQTVFLRRPGPNGS